MDQLICYDLHSHVKQVKRHTSAGCWLHNCSSNQNNKKTPSKGSQNTKEMESWCICPSFALFWVLNHLVHLWGPPSLINIVVHLNQTPRLSTTKARSTQELNIKLSFLTISHPRCGAGDWPRVVGCWVGAGFGSGAHLVPGSLLVW